MLKSVGGAVESRSSASRSAPARLETISCSRPQAGGAGKCPSLAEYDVLEADDAPRATASRLSRTRNACRRSTAFAGALRSASSSGPGASSTRASNTGTPRTALAPVGTEATKRETAAAATTAAFNRVLSSSRIQAHRWWWRLHRRRLRRLMEPLLRHASSRLPNHRTTSVVAPHTTSASPAACRLLAEPMWRRERRHPSRDTLGIIPS